MSGRSILVDRRPDRGCARRGWRCVHAGARGARVATGRLCQEHACGDQAGGAEPARRACRASRAPPRRLLSPGGRGAAARAGALRARRGSAAARRVGAGRPTLVRAAAGALCLKHDARRGGRRRQLDAVDACGLPLQH